MARLKNSQRRATWTVSLTNFLNSGAIVAGASGLALWTSALNLNSLQVGLLGAFSANSFGAALGALVGGWLADQYGRKVIYSYDMLIYLLGVIIVVLAGNFPFLLTGFLITGLAVGIGIPASWTYVAETANDGNRASQVGISQFDFCPRNSGLPFWGMGSTGVIYLLGSMCLYYLAFATSTRRIPAVARPKETPTRRSA